VYLSVFASASSSAFVVVVGPHYLVNVERFRAPVFVVVVA